MLENILHYERDLFFSINGTHSPIADNFMWIYSGYFIWAPILLLFIWLLVRNQKRETWLPVLIAITTLFILCNIFSGLICKPLFTRFRPTHHPDFMEQVRSLNGYVGHLYGFISGHSTSAFGFATLTALLFKNRYYTLLISLWALLMGYSRIYLGVHFITDVIAGATSGIIIGLLVFYGYKSYIKKRESAIYTPPYSNETTKQITLLIGGYILLFGLLSGQLVHFLS